MDHHALIRFAECVLFDEQAHADTRRQAKVVLAELIEALPIGAESGPGNVLSRTLDRAVDRPVHRAGRPLGSRSLGRRPLGRPVGRPTNVVATPIQVPPAGEPSVKRGPGRPRGSKSIKTRAPASVGTRSGQLAAKLKTFVEGKAELSQEVVFKMLGLKKSQSTTIEVGRALSLLGYASQRVGKGNRRRVVYTNA